MKKKIASPIILNSGTSKSYSFNFVAKTILNNIGRGKNKLYKIS
jgi:hypothetical protein